MTKQIVKMVILIGIVLAGIVVFYESRTHYVGRVFDDLVMDNRNHYLSCDQLPKIEDVDKIVREHRDVVEQIIKEVGRNVRGTDVIPLWDSNSVRDGENFYIEFRWGAIDPSCQNTDRGDIEITYPAHEDRIIIERIINSDTFFGVPYRLRNI